MRIFYSIHNAFEPCFEEMCLQELSSYEPLLTSSHLLLLYSAVCVGPGRKSRRQVFSYNLLTDLLS